MREIMDEAAAAGLTLVRAWAHGSSPEYALQPQPGRFSEPVFRGLDYALDQARQRGIKARAQPGCSPSCEAFERGALQPQSGCFSTPDFCALNMRWTKRGSAATRGVPNEVLQMCSPQCVTEKGAHGQNGRNSSPHRLHDSRMLALLGVVFTHPKLPRLRGAAEVLFVFGF